MKEYEVFKNEEGMSLIGFLKRKLPGAENGLLRAQLRKKNINLNGKKASGNERLRSGDKLQVYFSDETINKFEGDADIFIPASRGQVRVLYEDEDIIALDKRAGELSQQERAGQISLNEELIAYLLSKGEVSGESLRTVRPSVCNRLDRNTSGIVLCGKTMKGLRFLNGSVKKKHYKCIVRGRAALDGEYEGYITKSEKDNISRVSEDKLCDASKHIATVYRTDETLSTEYGSLTLVGATLITGRSHQIRAQLAHLGYPIAGDAKYGDRALNKRLYGSLGIKRQLLHAESVELEGGIVIKSPLPGDFLKIWQHGKQEV